MTTLFDYSEEQFDRVLAVNVKGVWLGLREVSRAMLHGWYAQNGASLLGLPTGYWT